MTLPEDAANDMAMLNDAINVLIEARTNIEAMFRTIYQTTTIWEQLGASQRDFLGDLIASSIQDAQGNIATVATHISQYT